MAFEMKCVCPDEDLHSLVAREYPFFTLAEAAAVASGYSPCCAYSRENAELRYCGGDKIEYAFEDMDLWERALRRAVGGGELASVRNRLEPTERLIPRNALESWIDQRRQEGVFEETEKNSESILIQRVKAIEKAIKAQSYAPQAITLQQKAFLKKKMLKNAVPSFTDCTFAKAWIEGGRLKKWAIENKNKFLPRTEPSANIKVKR